MIISIILHVHVHVYTCIHSGSVSNGEFNSLRAKAIPAPYQFFKSKPMCENTLEWDQMSWWQCSHLFVSTCQWTVCIIPLVLSALLQKLLPLHVSLHIVSPLELPDGTISAQYLNPAVSTALLKEIWGWQQSSASISEVVSRLRPQTAPKDYAYCTCKLGMQRTCI